VKSYFEKFQSWRVFHHLPAIAYFPLGIATFGLSLVEKTFSYALSFFSSDDRDPNKDFTAVCDDSRKWKHVNDISETKFDPGFLFGVATCTYQDSGAANCPNSQWAEWEKTCLPEDNRSGKSADLFTLYQTEERRKDITDRLHKLGVNSYRFSIEWSHIEPEEGVFDELKLQTYVDFCKHLRDKGITPMVTLHHFSEPKWFHNRGSFEKEGNIQYFVSFAKKVFSALTQSYRQKPLVEYFCTINEPAIDAFSRYIRGAFSPGLSRCFSQAGQFLFNALKAHCIAYEALKKINTQVQIGITHQRLVLSGTNPFIRVITRYINRLVNETSLNFFRTGTFSYRMPFSCHYHEERFSPKTDFIGLQYYARPVIGLCGVTSKHGEPMTQMPLHEDPEGLYEAILEAHEAFKAPVIVTENGISTHDEVQRDRYIERALYAAYRARKVLGDENLLGYFPWSFCDNSEWNMGMKPQRFGAFALGEDGTLAKEPREGLSSFIEVARRSREDDEGAEAS